jgi:hypothetical protein
VCASREEEESEKEKVVEHGTSWNVEKSARAKEKETTIYSTPNLNPEP